MKVIFSGMWWRREMYYLACLFLICFILVLCLSLCRLLPLSFDADYSFALGDPADWRSARGAYLWRGREQRAGQYLIGSWETTVTTPGLPYGRVRWRGCPASGAFQRDEPGAKRTNRHAEHNWKGSVTRWAVRKIKIKGKHFLFTFFFSVHTQRGAISFCHPWLSRGLIISCRPTHFLSTFIWSFPVHLFTFLLSLPSIADVSHFSSIPSLSLFALFYLALFFSFSPCFLSYSCSEIKIKMFVVMTYYTDVCGTLPIS